MIRCAYTPHNYTYANPKKYAKQLGPRPDRTFLFGRAEHIRSRDGASTCQAQAGDPEVGGVRAPVPKLEQLRNLSISWSAREHFFAVETSTLTGASLPFAADARPTACCAVGVTAK